MEKNINEDVKRFVKLTEKFHNELLQNNSEVKSISVIYDIDNEKCDNQDDDDIITYYNTSYAFSNPITKEERFEKVWRDIIAVISALKTFYVDENSFEEDLRSFINDFLSYKEEEKMHDKVLEKAISNFNIEKLCEEFKDEL